MNRKVLKREYLFICNTYLNLEEIKVDNKNYRSNSFAVREAENIIENYLRDREISDINNYYQLRQKYERLKILTIAMFITCLVGTLLSVIFK